MIVENYEGFSRDELKELFSQIKVSSGNVYQLLEDLLLWARNQLHKVSFEQKPCNLHELGEKAINYLEPQAESKSIKLDLQIIPETEVFADMNMVETVIRNLVSNAIKFSHKDGTIVISASEANEFIQVAVKDSGIGIKPEDLNKLFDKTASHTTYGTQGEKGTGIGLDLCSDFIEKNGGKIWVESEYGKGSTFFFTLKKKQ
jgi:signal transduction histidine kinase